MNEIQKYSQKDLKITAWNSLSDASKSAYQADFDLFFKFANKPVSEITPNDILQYIEYLKEIGRKNRTINRKVCSLSKMFSVLKIAGEVNENPVETLRKFDNINLKFDKGAKVPITLKDIESMKAVTVNDKRLIMIINFMASTGLRISEMIDIKNNDIKVSDSKNMVINIKRGKGEKERTIYIDNSFYKEIKSLFPNSEQIDYLFYNSRCRKYNRQVLWKQITEFTEKQLGRKIHPHMFRHFWGTYQINVKKMDIKAVSLYMGHSNISTTLDFYVDTALEAKDAIIKIGGKK